jgi:superfamily II RNA helicase
MKECSKCYINKELCEFNNSKLYSDGKRCECRKCQKLVSKLYREKNRDIINEKNKIQYSLFPEIQKERSLKWKTNNAESHKLSNYKKSKKWEEKNKDKRKEYKNNYSSQRLKTDILFKLKRNVRIRINKFIKEKKNSSLMIIGCSYQNLKEHLEKNFTDNMLWDNYGKWHIDHIIPLSSAKNEEEVYKLCHYTNLQPLWAEDNLRKGNKII